MGTFNDGDSGSSIRTKINTAIQKTEGSSAISTIDVDGGAIDGVTLGTNSAVTEAQVDNININGNTISSTDTNGDVTIDPNGTGDVNVGNFKFDADQSVGAGQDNYVLTYDNSGGKISLEAASGGGGGADLYAANPSSATDPTASGSNAVAIGDNAVASGFASISIGKDSDATNTNSIALGRLSQSTGANGSVAIGLYADSSGDGSVAIGSKSAGDTAIATGETSVALGTARASGADSFAAAIANNTSSYGAQGANSIAMGRLTKATSADSISLGDNNNVANSDAIALGNTNTVTGSAGVAIGTSHTVSGFGALCFGGSTNTADQTYAVGFGAYAHARVMNMFAFGSKGFFSSGSVQSGLYILYGNTTDATAKVLTTDNSGAGTNDQIVLPEDAAFTFHGTIVGKQSNSANVAAWEVKGVIVNSNNTTTLTNSATTVISNVPNWNMALSADDTNEALAITCTGAASTSIRWVASIHTNEIIYA